MTVGDEREKVLRSRVWPAALADVFGRHGEVHAVGPAVDVLVDPGELHLEPFGLVRERPEHPEPAGVGDGGDDVATVAEGEDRELHAEAIADRCTHDKTSSHAALHPSCTQPAPARLRAATLRVWATDAGPLATRAGQRSGSPKLRFGVSIPPSTSRILPVR